MNSQIVKRSRFEQFLLRAGEMTRNDSLRWHRHRKTIYADFREWRLTLIAPIDDEFSTELEFSFHDHVMAEVENILFGGSVTGLAWLWDMAEFQIERLQTEPEKPVEDKQLRELVSIENTFFVERFLLDTMSTSS